MRTVPFVLAATFIVAFTVVQAQISAPVPAQSARQAVERALPLLQENARRWTLERPRCFSCHHQGLGATTIAVARERGFRVDDAQLTGEVSAIRALLPGPDVASRLEPNLDYLDHSLALVALGAVDARRDEAIDRGIYRLLGGQHMSGRWTPVAPRLPLQGSSVAQTAWAIRALQSFPAASRTSEIDSRIARARAWLERETPVETQDAAMQLLAFAWLDAPSDRIDRAAARLIALQRAEGGWGQTPARPSDAYATGQALVALNQAGRIPPDSASFRKGVGFLTRSQQPDGSWLVETRRTWMRGLPYFESGFPHGKHQFISYAGTAWATLALALDGRHEQSAIIMGKPKDSTIAQRGSAAESDGPLTPLMRAALLGSRADLRAVLDTKPDLNAVATPLGVTALMCAAHDAAKVALLIEAGADVRIATTAGHTALLVAADYDGAAESVRLLLKHGADPNARSKGVIGVSSPLVRAALRGDRAVAAMLLDAGATLNDRPDGSSPLIAAAQQVDVDLVTFFLDRGANLESHLTVSPPVVNGESQPTPLMIAADRSAVDLVTVLLKRGADVNARDRQEMTPLMYAAGAIDVGAHTTAVLERLIAAKADISARTKAGKTALDFAQESGNAEAVARLRPRGSAVR